MIRKIEKCANGHYFDKSLSPVCPYCENAGTLIGDTYTDDLPIICPYCENAGTLIGDEGTTVGYPEFLDDGPTVAIDGIDKTIGIFNPVVGWLVCVEGAEKGRDYRIISGRNYVGRSPDNSICIADDDSVSRKRHFSIVYDPKSGRFFAVPGDSSSIQINGEFKFNKQILQDGDIITCGDTKLCFIGFCKEGRNWT